MSHKDDVFIRVFFGVLLGLVVFTIAIIILANSVGQLEQQRVGGGPTGPAAVEDRIQPVAKVRIVGQTPAAPAAAAAPMERSGKQVSEVACNACHATGAAGAPKIGDQKQWASRAKLGVATLVDHAINGIRGMPAKGGNPTLTDEEVRKAVVYMLEEVGVSAQGGGQAKASAAPSPAPTQVASAGEGMQIYTTACAACHATGAAGAPRVGDTAAWTARIAQGMDALHQNAIVGIRSMPAKGGRLDLSDGAVKAAVVYMVENSQ